MNSEKAFLEIVELERTLPPCLIEWQSINMWPLVRQCLWQELFAEPVKKPDTQISIRRFRQKIGAVVRRLRRAAGYIKGRLNPDALGNDPEYMRHGTEETAFVSRIVYLQRLPSGELFDRIVDPLIFASENRSIVAKYYVDPLPGNATLYYPAQCIRSNHVPGRQDMPEDVLTYLEDLANAAGLNAIRLRAQYAAALQHFKYWYEASNIFFAGRPDLKTVYLTSWYFPDMMAITAAAKARGITVIDVQHGKQGKFQPMYSGWNRIPEAGYLMMPDRFWCWGQASCDHILAASPHRKVHRPFVGGFPWLDYYGKYVSSASANLDNNPVLKSKRRILVTTQPIRGDNKEVIPDFLIDYLLSDSTGLNHFVFRRHPNDAMGPEYFQRCLASIPAHLYSIDIGEENLIDKILQSTHHITANSSCCYEAEVFGVPTLLFGQDAKAIYSEEIASGKFVWINGSVAELANWLESDTRQHGMRQQQSKAPYIVSSLAHAASVLANNAA